MAFTPTASIKQQGVADRSPDFGAHIAPDRASDCDADRDADGAPDRDADRDFHGAPDSDANKKICTNHGNSYTGSMDDCP